MTHNAFKLWDDLLLPMNLFFEEFDYNFESYYKPYSFPELFYKTENFKN